MPRLYWWDSKRQIIIITSACKNFVDDSWSVAAPQKLARYPNHRIETVMCYLGLHDATKKRRSNYKKPGEWTGSITLDLENVGLYVAISEKKWGRAKETICNLLEKFNDDDHSTENDLKDMEWKTGFLVHLAMAYQLVMPCMRDLYLTMNSFWHKRDRESWK